MAQSNEGIQVFGGSFQANIVGVGSGVRIALQDAKQSLQERGLDEVATKLDQLLQAVERGAHELDDERRVQVLQDTEEVAHALTAAEPPKATVLTMLARLATATGSVLSIATAVEGLKSVVMRLV